MNRKSVMGLMTRTGMVGGILAAGVLLALAGTAASDAADSNSGCTQEAFEVDAAAVIAPCTALLQKPDLSVAARSHALFIRGQGYHRTKQILLAQKDYEAASKLTPDDDAIYPKRANVAFRLGQVEDALAFLRRALALNPKNARAMRMIGQFLGSAGQNEDAIKYYSMALDVDPGEAYALLFRSYAYQRDRRYDLALKDADALVAMPADAINRQGYLDRQGVKRDFHLKALTDRADIYAAMGQYDLAERDLNAAVDYKRSADSLLARGEFLMHRPGRQRLALDDLEAATTLDPEMLQAFYLKGEVLVGFQRYDEALAALDRALTIDPHYDFALRLRAITYRALGKTDLAVQDLENAVVSSPRVAAMTIRSLQIAGYWPYGEAPRALTPGLQDAIRACMLDNDCH
jgi:tetratricopeptide (TPR) repeat protein